jgi:hypothetical protein
MAHFLGIVVAYEALHAHPDLHVYLLVDWVAKPEAKAFGPALPGVRPHPG